MLNRTVTAGIMAILLNGCGAFTQPSEVVLVREPGNRAYSDPVLISHSAKDLWQYAALSANVYLRAEQAAAAAVGKQMAPPPSDEAYATECLGDAVRLPLEAWERWDNFPTPESKEGWARDLGLNVEVWQTKTRPRIVAVVFEGTNFTSLPDWRANLRWFLRFVPGYKDQYIAVASEVGAQFGEELAKRIVADGGANELRLIATGHSLGGGLAQHFAYSLRTEMPNKQSIPRVSRVYAFDPSPVTGWFSVPKELREHNAEGLVIDRIFEHGEILAYIRLIQSYVMPPSAKNPAVREIRYNFIRTLNPIRSHSMYQLACDLMHAATGSTGSAHALSNQ